MGVLPSQHRTPTPSCASSKGSKLRYLSPPGRGESHFELSPSDLTPARAAGAIAARLAAATAAMLALPTRLAVTAWAVALRAVTTGPVALRAITLRAITLWAITARTIRAWAVAVAMRGAHGIAVGGDTGRALMARAFGPGAILPHIAQWVEDRSARRGSGLAVVADPLVADVLIA